MVAHPETEALGRDRVDRGEFKETVNGQPKTGTCHLPLKGKILVVSVTSWTIARQAPLFLEFSRPAYWSGLPFPSAEDLPNPGTEPRSPALQADSLLSEPPGKP